MSITYLTINPSKILQLFPHQHHLLINNLHSQIRININVIIIGVGAGCVAWAVLASLATSQTARLSRAQSAALTVRASGADCTRSRANFLSFDGGARAACNSRGILTYKCLLRVAVVRHQIWPKLNLLEIGFECGQVRLFSGQHR